MQSCVSLLQSMTGKPFEKTRPMISEISFPGPPFFSALLAGPRGDPAHGGIPDGRRGIRTGRNQSALDYIGLCDLHAGVVYVMFCQGQVEL